MSKIHQYSASEKLIILQELEKGEIVLKEVAKKYDITKSTLVKWRHRYELHGYEDLEIRIYNKKYPVELKIQAVQDYLSGFGIDFVHRNIEY